MTRKSIKSNDSLESNQRNEVLDGAQAIFRQKAIDAALAASTGDAGLKQGQKAKDLLQSSDGGA